MARPKRTRQTLDEQLDDLQAKFERRSGRRDSFHGIVKQIVAETFDDLEDDELQNTTNVLRGKFKRDEVITECVSPIGSGSSTRYEVVDPVRLASRVQELVKGYEPHKKTRRKRSLPSSIDETDDLIMGELSRGRWRSLRKNPFLAYFIAEDIGLEPRGQGGYGMRRLVDRVEEEIGIAPPRSKGSFMGYDSFFGLHYLLGEDVETGCFDYFVPEGLYLAGKQLALEGKNLTLPVAYGYTRKKENLAALLRVPETQIPKSWNPHLFDMTLKNIDFSLDFMKKRFRKDKDGFFSKYGSPAGAQALVDDMKPKKNLKTSLRKMHTLISNGEMLARMLKVKDKRFKTHWNPQVIYLSLDDRDLVRGILQDAHTDDPERFYAVYGSPAGVIFLSKELQQRHGKSISPFRLSSALVKPKKAQEISGIVDPTFAKKWNVKTSTFSDSGTLDVLVEHLEKRYKQDPDGFFLRYGCDVGSYHIAEDIAIATKRRKSSTRKPIDLDLDPTSAFMRDGELVAGVMGNNDKRFRTQWNPVKTKMNYSDAVKVLEFLEEAYTADPEDFFARYGSAIGSYYFMKDLCEDPDIKRNPTVTDVNWMFLRGERLEKLLEVEDKRFRTEWKPRSFSISPKQTDAVVDFMGSAYIEDSGRFFAKYGAEDGLLALTNDLEREAGLVLSPFRLAALTSDPESMQLFLDVDDERFETDWSPRSIQIKAGIAGRVKTFLRQKYDQDPLRFFVRYGGRSGQYLLNQDLGEEGIGVPSLQLNSLVGSSSLVAKLTGIPKSKFEGKWNNKACYLGQKYTGKVVDFLREKHVADPDLFFRLYGNPEGVRHLVAGLKREKGISPNVHHLTRVVMDGSIVASLMSVEDERFQTEWDVPEISVNARQMHPASEHLREQYFTNRDSFFARYGSPLGAWHLASDLEAKGSLVTKSLHHLSSLVQKRSVQGALGIEDERFEKEWHPKLIKLPFQDLKSLGEHLYSQYEADPDGFFTTYGNRLGTIILAGEANKYLGIQARPEHFSTILSDGNVTAALVDSRDDERFSEMWNKEKYNGALGQGSKFQDLERLVVSGVTRMASSCLLPNTEELDKSDRDYLKLRYGLRNGDVDTALYIVHLYAENYGNRVQKKVETALRRDNQRIDMLESVNGMGEIREWGEEEFT